MRYSTERCALPRAVVAVMAAALLAAGCATAPVTPTAAEAVGDGDTLSPALRGQYDDALTLLSVDDLDGAAQLLGSIAVAQPQHPEAATTLAIVYRRQGRGDEARALLEQTLAVHGEFAPAWNELGILHREAGQFADAEAAYLKAVTVRPDYALAHLNVGILYDLYLGRLDEALAHYERYQELSAAQDKQVGRWIADVSRRIQRTTQTARAQ